MELVRTVTLERPEPEEMQSSKKQRRGSKKYAQRRAYSKSSMPMAIRNRGTPDGYYELPVRTLFKLYCNSTTGLWNTDQGTGAQIGLTGYRGFGIGTSLDAVRIDLGEGGSATSVTLTVPGFSELQAVFDLCKIADMQVDYWWTTDPRELTTAAHGYMDMYTVVDPNDTNPPANLGNIMQYSKVTRIPSNAQNIVKQKFKPYIRTVAGTSAEESGTASTVALAQPSTYIQCAKPGIFHFGVRGWVDIPPNAPTAVQTYLNILVTQVRRYKIGK